MNQKLYNGLTKLKLSHKKAYRVSNNKYYIDNNIEKIIHFLDKRCDSDYFFKQYLSWIKFNKENQIKIEVQIGKNMNFKQSVINNTKSIKIENILKYNEFLQQQKEFEIKQNKEIRKKLGYLDIDLEVLKTI